MLILLEVLVELNSPLQVLHREVSKGEASESNIGMTQRGAKCTHTLSFPSGMALS